MANYNLTNQTISSSFEQLVQHDNDTNILYDGTGSVINNLEVTSSLAISSSHAENSDNSISASYAVSASQSENADNAISASHAILADNAIEIFVNVKNTSGFDIPKGTAVHSSGVTGDKINITTASYEDPNLMPAIGITQTAISNNAVGEVILSGRIQGLNTSNLIPGATVYVNGDGSLTATKPTGSALIQNIGTAVKINATEGEILVLGSGRTNDLPNLTSGYAWVGDGNGVPQAVSTASWDAIADLTELNAFTASQELINSGYNTFTSSADGRLDNIESTTSSLQTEINGLSSFTGSYATTGSNTFIGDQIITGSLSVNNNINAGTFGKTDGTSTYTGSLNGEFTGSISVSSIDTGDINVDGTIDVINGGINTSTNTTVSIGRELFVTQSQISSTGAIVFSYPFTGIGGSEGQLTQRFFKDGPASKYEQKLSGVDAGEFVAFNADLKFTNEGNGNIQFVSPNGGMNFQSLGSQTSNQIIQKTTSAISGNGQKDSIQIGSYTGANGVVYNTNVWGIQNYPGSGYNNAFTIGKYNSAFTYVSEFFVGEGAVKATIAKGNYDYDFILLQDNQNGTTSAVIKADQIQLGGSPNNQIIAPAPVTLQQALTLGQQDPLPSGGVGQLAVSSSADLYYHNGTAWAKIN